MWTTFYKRPYRFSFGFGYERWSIVRRWIYFDFAWWRFSIVWEIKEK